MHPWPCYIPLPGLLYVEEVEWIDPARLEADISRQLDLDTPWVSRRDEHEPLVEKNERMKNTYSSSSNYALNAPSLATSYTHSISYPWSKVRFNQTKALEVNPVFCSVGNIDFSFLQSSNSFTVEDVWDGEKVHSENVSKWVASKLRSIADTIGVAFSGYESEVTQLLSRIEKNSVVPKQRVKRQSSASRRQREVRRIEFGVNYDRISSSPGGLLVPYV